MVINQFHIKSGITVGAFGGFIASMAFIGIMLCLPLIVSLPIGIFLHALGLSVIKPIENAGYGSSDTVSGGGGGGGVDITRIGLAAFGLVLAQGVIVGIIFGIITAKIKKLHITNIRKGVTLGLATGVIACLVLFVSVILTIYPSMLTNALASYSQTMPFSLQGLHTHAIITQSQNSYLSILLGYGLFAYLVYGFILGGTLVWASSLYRFNMSKALATELEKYR